MYTPFIRTKRELVYIHHYVCDKTYKTVFLRRFHLCICLKDRWNYLK